MKIDLQVGGENAGGGQNKAWQQAFSKNSKVEKKKMGGKPSGGGGWHLSSAMIKEKRRSGGERGGKGLYKLREAERA